MQRPDELHFWHAVNSTEVLVMPTRRLETFGATVLNYHMLSELMDTVNQVRIREGRIHAYRPQVLTPAHFASCLLEGFGHDAEEYVHWLRDNAADLQFLRYGFAVKKEVVSEQTVTEDIRSVAERVKRQVQERDDPLSAVLIGVDQPWEVCLIKLMVDVVRGSAPGNYRELKRSRMLDEEGGVPRAVRLELESDFQAAGRNPSLVRALGSKLQRYGLFEDYQDRFFALLKAAGMQ